MHPSRLTRHSFRHTGSCISSYLINLLCSNLRSAFYIGETQTPLTIRINNHRSSFKSQLPQFPKLEYTSHHGHTFDKIFRVNILKIFNPDSTVSGRKMCKQSSSPLTTNQALTVCNFPVHQTIVFPVLSYSFRLELHIFLFILSLWLFCCFFILITPSGRLLQIPCYLPTSSLPSHFGVFFGHFRNFLLLWPGYPFT